MAYALAMYIHNVHMFPVIEDKDLEVKEEEVEHIEKVRGIEEVVKMEEQLWCLRRRM